MEYCSGGELYKLLYAQKGNRFQEKDVQFYAAEVLVSLQARLRSRALTIAAVRVLRVLRMACHICDGAGRLQHCCRLQRVLVCPRTCLRTVL
jgi:serine/threonine protein kinase